MASRAIKDLIEPMQERYHEFAERMGKEGIDYIVTCTRRLQSEQNALYEQGRSKPGRIVTWTRDSRHIKGEAFDIVIMENGKPDWNVTNPKWTKAGAIGRAAGLTWGGSWRKSKDYPHFELAET